MVRSSLHASRYLLRPSIASGGPSTARGRAPDPHFGEPVSFSRAIATAGIASRTVTPTAPLAEVAAGIAPRKVVTIGSSTRSRVRPQPVLSSKPSNDAKPKTSGVKPKYVRPLPPPLSELGLTAAEFLATCWVNGKLLNKHASLSGYTPKRGSWTVAESDVVDKALKQHAKVTGTPIAEIFAPRRHTGHPSQRELWSALARLVPMRPVRLVWDTLVGRYHPLRNDQSKTWVPRKTWTSEEDAQLALMVELYGEYGSGRWVLIGEAVGKTSNSAWDRWRYLGTFKSGPWTEEEKARLFSAREEHGEEWEKVAMDVGTRTRAECRRYWERAHSSDRIHKRQYIEVLHAVASQSASEASSVDWERIHIAPVKNSSGRPQSPFPSTRVLRMWDWMATFALAEGITDHRAQVAWLLKNPKAVKVDRSKEMKRRQEETKKAPLET